MPLQDQGGIRLIGLPNASSDGEPITKGQLGGSSGHSLVGGLGSLATASTAADVPIADSGGRFTGTEVETALSETATTASLAASSGSSLIGFIQSGTGAVATDLQTKARQIRSVFDYMTAAQIADVIAYGYTEDLTTAIQAAIDDVLTLTGGWLFFPLGGYKITDELSIPFSAGWRIIGASRLGCVIKQYTSNKAHLRFDYENTHSWTVSSLFFTWSSQQTTSNTNSSAFYMKGPAAPTGAGIYNFTIMDCAAEKGFRFIQGNSSTKMTIWGGYYLSLWHYSTMVGSFFNAAQGTATGQPNNRFASIYINASNVSATESIFYFNACENTEFNNVEINQVSLGATVINLRGGSSLTVGSFKLEGGTWTTSGQKINVISDSEIKFDRFLLSSVTIDVGAGNKAYLFGQAGTNHIHVGFLDITNVTLTSGSLFAFGQGGSTSPIVVDQITN